MEDSKTLKVYNEKILDYIKLTDRKPSNYLISFAKKIAVGNLVLDLGCGPGNASAYMRAEGLLTVSVDASIAMVKWANKNYNLNAKLMTFDQIDEKDVYDGVYANFSLLHITKTDFKKNMLAIQKAMKPGALLSLGMKVGSGQKRDKLGRFYCYYSEEELSGIARKSGFTRVEKFSGEEKGLAGDLDSWIVLQLRKN